MKKYLFIPFLVFLPGIVLIQCSAMEKEKKYDYSISVCSADGYDCRISWSDCYLGKYAIPFTTFGSWGGGGASASVASGPQMKPLPDSIRLIYFSLPENQFYALKAALPQDEIRALLNGRYKVEGYDDPATFFKFTIGIAPCGFVSLWLSGDAGKILIDTYHAAKVDVDYGWAFPTHQWTREEAFKEYSEELYPFIQEEQRQQRISSAYWESLNQHYNWKLAFSDSDFSLYDYRIHLLNSEYRMYLTNPDWLVAEGDKYIPVELTLYLQHRLDPIKYKVVIKLRAPYVEYTGESYLLKHMNKSRSLLQFFDSFYKQAGDEQVSVYLDFDFSMEKMKLKLKAGDYEEEFPDYTYRIYDSERYNYR